MSVAHPGFLQVNAVCQSSPVGGDGNQYLTIYILRYILLASASRPGAKKNTPRGACRQPQPGVNQCPSNKAKA
ncbi:hypothetical protein L541_1951 [Bordetella hinzii CA90 BAL1384]|nr:hypothetical protein L541_1951 [Bordetella hinzii CA90 BAL1384]KCB28644.1 hypothetical protein L543_1534 [Bordetella hinzii L60]KCB49069.1 hypothetical protein L537_1868 [Bordetella hinzii 1277]